MGEEQDLGRLLGLSPGQERVEVPPDLALLGLGRLAVVLRGGLFSRAVQGGQSRCARSIPCLREQPLSLGGDRVGCPAPAPCPLQLLQPGQPALAFTQLVHIQRVEVQVDQVPQLARHLLQHILRTRRGAGRGAARGAPLVAAGRQVNSGSSPAPFSAFLS